MKITLDWLDQFFNIFSQLGKMLLYLFNFLEENYETSSFNS